jgi:hypothetical protein
VMECPSPLKGNNITYECECPKELFLSELGGCIKCSEICKSCTRDPSKCDSCDDPLLLYQNKCVKECPQGSIINYLEKSCEGECD